jgi:hypothetical protein
VESDIKQCASSDTNESTPADIPYAALEGDNSIWRIEPEISLGIGYTFHNHLDIHGAYTYIGGANDQQIIDKSLFSDSNNSAYEPKARVYKTNILMVGIAYTF